MIILGASGAGCLDLPDGRLADVHDAAVSAIGRELERTAPEAIITFPPNGMNGHPDHVSTHRAVADAIGHSGGRRPMLYYFAGTEPFEERERPGYLSVSEVRDTTLAPSLHVPLGPAVRTKVEALGHYETQARSVAKFMRQYPQRMVVESFTTVTPRVGDGMLERLAGVIPGSGGALGPA